jgi:hypothetical protein
MRENTQSFCFSRSIPLCRRIGATRGIADGLIKRDSPGVDIKVVARFFPRLAIVMQSD